MSLTEHEALLALHLAIPFIPAKGHQLLRHFGNARTILSATAGDIEDALEDKGHTAEIALAIEKVLQENRTQKMQTAAAEMGVEILDYFDPTYPRGLQALADPPFILYRKGEATSLSVPSIAIVGTRQASIYGKTMACEFANVCGQQGIPVISGLARGIDTAAHEGALEYGATIAVIGSGFAHIYPRENTELARKICAKGALYSEYPLFTRPDRFQFPRRNRLIAAMADGALLVEAPEKSGAMGTLEWSIRLKKTCFALPGRADTETFRGNHRLIKDGKAKLVENGAEMISLLSPGLFRQTEKKEKTAELTAAEHQLLLRFPQKEISFDELAVLSRLPTSTLNALLIGLSIKNIIREYPGKLFRKVV